MNAVQLFREQAREHPRRVALCIPKAGPEFETITFSELLGLAAKAQTLFKAQGIRAGSSVLVFDSLGVRLYASVIALLAMGASVVFVEPWLSMTRIERIIQTTHPELFLSNFAGFMWGARVKAIRMIKKWMKCESILNQPKAEELHLEDVPPSTIGIITFTSGTTGEPKGVVRGHGYLERQCQVLSKHLDFRHFTQPDLCVFANFALLNLACGRGSILVPQGWDAKTLKALDQLPKPFRPQTLTAGPAFLLHLMKHGTLPELKSIHIGGALTDCWIFEQAFERWPHAEFKHVYGGSEAEPVALVDAKVAVRESRRRGYFQTLYLGRNIPEIKPAFDLDSLWVSGPHVCPEYWGNEQENQTLKRKDLDGTLWHCMGDRIQDDVDGWWYQGRSGQLIHDFNLEQRIYRLTRSSKSFVVSQTHVNAVGKWLVGEGLIDKKSVLLKEFPELDGIVEAKIIRDKRHRSRIDRVLTLKQGAPWVM